jgi:hypothetical protein
LKRKYRKELRIRNLYPKNPDKSKVYWQGAVSREVFDGFTDHLINDYFKRPNYYTIDGKPVFAIYEVSTFIRGMGSDLQAKEALLDNLDKIAVQDNRN